MYGQKRQRQIREFALYLHGGIPETPVPVYETDSQCFSDDRPDGISDVFVHTPSSEVVAVAKWEPGKGLVISSTTK